MRPYLAAFTGTLIRRQATPQQTHALLACPRPVRRPTAIRYVNQPPGPWLARTPLPRAALNSRPSRALSLLALRYVHTLQNN